MHSFLNSGDPTTWGTGTVDNNRKRFRDRCKRLTLLIIIVAAVDTIVEVLAGKCFDPFQPVEDTCTCYRNWKITLDSIASHVVSLLRPSACIDVNAAFGAISVSKVQ